MACFFGCFCHGVDNHVVHAGGDLVGSFSFGTDVCIHQFSAFFGNELDHVV